MLIFLFLFVCFLAAIKTISCLFDGRWTNTRSGDLRRPPGPFSWPIIGNLMMFMDSPHLKCMKMAQQYGDVFQIRIGSWPVVVLNGYDTIRQALVGKSTKFIRRPPFRVFEELNWGISVSVGTDIQAWKILRKAIHKALRCMEHKQVGFQEDVIIAEADLLVERYVYFHYFEYV